MTARVPSDHRTLTPRELPAAGRAHEFRAHESCAHEYCDHEYCDHEFDDARH